MISSLPTLSRRIGLSIAVALLGTSILAAQDILVMSNGDTLTGKYVQTTDGKIEFESDMLGTIMVPEDKATVKTAEAVAEETAAPQAAPATMQSAITGQAAPEKPKGWLRSLTRMPDNMAGSVTLGISSLEGTADAENYAFAFTLGQTLETQEWQIYSNYNYGESNDVKNTDNQRHGGWYKWYFAGDGRWFLHLQASWHQDRIQRLEA